MTAVLVSCVLALVSLMTRVDAQSTAEEARFEVAVVKVNDSGEVRVAGGFQPGGRYSVTNYPLRALVAAAYLRPQVNPDFLIAGGPEWMDTARFNVEARAQRLLADRFGPSLRPSQIDCGTASAPAPDRCLPRIGPGTLALTAASLTALVNLLPRFVDHVVVDATGLTGRFDIELKWTPGPTEWVAPSSSANAAPGDDGSSLTTALREQLGLRLQAQTGPVDVLVIDAATWPTGN